MIGSRAVVVLGLLLAWAAVTGGLAPPARAEQASQPARVDAARIDAGTYHSCAVLSVGAVRCWGVGDDGQLGYAGRSTIGDDEAPSAAGPVDMGSGRTATAISVGTNHTCALLDDGTVRCWGRGADGRLGYGNGTSIGDDEAPGSVGPVSLGLGRRATAISAGGAHSCALLDDGTVRCWGRGTGGRLGYGNGTSIGDDETPAAAGPVDLGAGRTAVAVSAGGAHTCALLDDGTVRCWGFGGDGRLGYGDRKTIGDNETPGSVGPIDLGTGRKAKAIAAGDYHTCALLDDGTVRCWGFGIYGELGSGSTANIGDDESPASVPTVDLGAGRTAKAITAGGPHTCALLDDGTVRCWGFGIYGQLGYADVRDIGDNEPPGSVGPVDLGAGRRAVAVSAGGEHTCARLDDGSVRCWGYGGNGRLGYCNEKDIGDDEAPGAVGPVDIGDSAGGMACPSLPAPRLVVPAARGTDQARPNAAPGADAARARGLRACLTAVAARRARERRRARRGSARTRRQADLGAASARRRCLRTFGRPPDRVRMVRAQALSATAIELEFAAPASGGATAQPARSYLVRRSLGPIPTAGGFARATALCGGHCRVTVARVGERASIIATHLRPGTRYHFAIAARDNVSGMAGPWSPSVTQRTRDRVAPAPR